MKLTKKEIRNSILDESVCNLVDITYTISEIKDFLDDNRRIFLNLEEHVKDGEINYPLVQEATKVIQKFSVIEEAVWTTYLGLLKLTNEEVGGK